MLFCSVMGLFCAAVLNASSVSPQDEFGKKKKKSLQKYIKPTNSFPPLKAFWFCTCNKIMKGRNSGIYR